MKNVLRTLRANWGKTVLSLFILGLIGLSVYGMGRDLYSRIQKNVADEKYAEFVDSLEYTENETEEEGEIDNPFTEEIEGPQITEEAATEPPLVAPEVDSDITPENILVLVNYERAKAGLPALTRSLLLERAAEEKAKDMVKYDYFAHYEDGRPPYTEIIQGQGYTYVRAGENLGRDFKTVQGLMQAWMESTTHRANILNQGYAEIGIAVEGEYAVQMFGLRR